MVSKVSCPILSFPALKGGTSLVPFRENALFMTYPSFRSSAFAMPTVSESMRTFFTGSRIPGTHTSTLLRCRREHFDPDRVGIGPAL